MKVWKMAVLAIVASLCFPLTGLAVPAVDWDLIIPSGEIERYPVVPADRITTLDGMTIGLRRNGKHNSDILLDRLAEYLTRDFPTATIIKFYGPDALFQVGQSGTIDRSMEVAQSIKDAGVDIVIAAQGD